MPFDSVEFIVWSIGIGVCIAFFVNYVYKRLVGPFIRNLIEQNVVGKENALTLKELYMDTWLKRWLLSDGAPLRKYISVVGGELPKDKDGKKPDFENARFYIEKESLEKCQKLFGKKENLFLALLFVVITLGVTLGLSKLIPIILALAS